jgi:hypothetical protein
MKKYAQMLVCGIAVFFLAGFFSACEWFDYPLDKYHEEQSGTLEIKLVREEEGSVSLGTDGYICVAPGTRTIVIPLDNPQGYAVREEGLVGFPEGLPDGVQVTARQSADKNAIEITVTGAVGDEFPISLTAKTAKEGRLLVSQTLNVACVNFETRLDALLLSGGSLAFDPDGKNFSINDISVSAVSVSYTKENDDTTVNISGGLRVEEDTVYLDIGLNIVTVKVTAAHGADDREYTLHLTRISVSSNADLSNLLVNGGTTGISNLATPGDLAGTVNVDYSTTSVNVIAIASDQNNATIKINGDAYTSGDTKTTNVAVGANTITVEVTAQNGTTTKLYTITVNRTASSNANLSSLLFNGNPTGISDLTDSEPLTATVTVGNAVTSVNVIAIASDINNAIIKINDVAYASGNTETIDVGVGDTPVTIVVTAQDSTTKTYTITVHRNNNAELTGLTAGTGSLSPAFSGGTTSYMVKVANSVNSITVTAAKSGAYTKINIAGTDYNSGTTAQKTISGLKVGDNTVAIEVTSEDGSTTKPYTLTVIVSGVLTLAGSGTADYAEGTGTSAKFDGPSGVAVDSAGNVYVADTGNHRIRKITPAGVVTTLAGSGTAGFADGTGTAAHFNQPMGVAVDGTGNVYVADTYNHRIRKITSSGEVTTLAGSGILGYVDGSATEARFCAPSDLAVDGSTVYVADTSSSCIRKITSTGEVATLAGNKFTADFADGTGTAAHFNFPWSVAVGSGYVYVADTYNHRIRKITSTGEVTTPAGSGTASFANGTGTAAHFNQPMGVAVDGTGNVYVADRLNHRIRKINPSGVVTTLAGSGTADFLDGDFLSAQFKHPGSVAVDSAGNVYVADTSNHRIRKIIP